MLTSFADPPPPPRVSSSDEEEDRSKLLAELVTESFETQGLEVEGGDLDFGKDWLDTRSPATTSGAAESAGKEAHVGELPICP